MNFSSICLLVVLFASLLLCQLTAGAPQKGKVPQAQDNLIGRAVLDMMKQRERGASGTNKYRVNLGN